MQRRYPGRHGQRGGPPEWRERTDRAYRDAGEHGMPDDPAPWPEEDDDPACPRFTSENVGPQDWGSEWSERAARPVGQRRGRADAGWPGTAREPTRAAERGYDEPGRHAQDRGNREGPYGDDRPAFRGHDRMGWYGGECDTGDPRGNVRYGGNATGLPGFGDDAERDVQRRRRGPKGYTRSDERIREDVCERLACALDIDVSDVTVEVHDGRVELDGTVPARWMKHDIEDLADSCMCVRDVENRVRVHRSGEHDTGVVLRPDQRTVTPTRPDVPDPDPEPGTAGRDRERKPNQ